MVALAVISCTMPAPLRSQVSRCATTVVPVHLRADAGHRLEGLRAPAAGENDVLHDAVACSPGAASAPVMWRGLSLTPVLPGVILQAQGGVADPRGTGAMWGGRGTSALVRGGFTADMDMVHVSVVPELWTAQNRPFEMFASPSAERSSFASSFYSTDASMDLPSRMGADPVRQLSPGQSAAWIQVANVAAGWSASNQLWGSGQDGLVLGANAAGIPRVFLRTAQPIVVEDVGQFSGVWFLGRLSESRFFDRTAENDERDVSAAAIVWTPPADRSLAIGAAHAVSRVREPGSSSGGSLLSAFRGANPESEDELTTIFSRMHLPRARLRAWVEVAHQGPLRLREIFTIPTADLAYRMGVEHAIERGAGSLLLLAEAANLEQSQDVLDRPQHDFYTGYGTPHGWTHRGQLLGDGAGPGGQSQFASADWVTRGWRAGVFAERVRRNEDALFREYLPQTTRHDVTMLGGLRAGYVHELYDVAVTVSAGTRLNYLFQNALFLPIYRTADVPVRQLRITMTPRLPARR